MASGTINASGIGSGIDILGLVDQLVAAERQRPEQLLNQRESRLDDQISAIGKLKSALSTFQDSLEALSSLNSFAIYSGSSSDKNVATVTADSSAVAGNFTLELNSGLGHQLASANKQISAGFADADTTSIGTGNIAISNGNGDSFNVNITSGNDTLNDIRDAINNDSNNFGVSATVLNVSDGMGGTVSKLVLTADDTGLDNALTVTADAGISALDGANLTEVTPGQDAIFTIDGQTVQSASNTVTGAISGVTIELQGEGTTTLALTADNSAIVDNVKAFVDAFNTLQDVFNETTAYNGGDPAPLFSDSTIKGLSGNIRDILLSSVTTTSGLFSSLSELGITTNDDGKLELNETELNSVLSTDFNSVAEIFAGSGGIVEQFNTKLEPYTQFAGLLDSKKNSLDSRKELIEDARERLDYRLGKLEDRLRAQFIAMDALVQSLNSTGSFLQQQLANLPGVKSSGGSN